MLKRTADVTSGGTATEATLDGRGLDAGAVARIADGALPHTVHPAALEAMERTHWAARRLAAEGTQVYGRSTGVGAHRGVAVEERDSAGHDLRLLLSHAGGVGDPLPARQVRAMMVVRLNQLLAGGSGLRPEIAVALSEALRARVHPLVNEYGSVGTGDLTALAQLGLALFGHGLWQRVGAGGVDGAAGVDGAGSGEPFPARPEIQPGDALALLSSNALTLGQSALACHDLGGLLRAAHVVAALSLHAIGGNLEPYAPEVHRAHPHPAIGRAAACVRWVLGVPDRRLSGEREWLEPGVPGRREPGEPGWRESGLPGQRSSAAPGRQKPGTPDRLEPGVPDRLEPWRPVPREPGAPEPREPGVSGPQEPGVQRLSGAPGQSASPSARVQDPFGFRCFPQAHGPATEAWASLDRVLSIDLNSATENPLIGWDEPTGAPVALVAPVAHHHGGFFAAPLTLALDQLCLAVLGTARLSAARLSGLGRPELTGLRSYLADEASAGSGMMILEYSAAAALAEIQAGATPAALGHVVLSQGLEEVASFATQAARKSLRMAHAYRLVLGCELVAAVRALRQRGAAPAPGTPAGHAYARAAAVLNPAMEDRPLTDDVAAAAALLDEFAELTAKC
ncbi:aromatic amino acid lyase [Streptomyces sp. NPDC001530]|uniref:aromatic amino acid lyase n=1 Tax=Streptomyces sp. NPDC001530 TaxID=3364582 RepID=UPI0036774710